MTLLSTARERLATLPEVAVDSVIAALVFALCAVSVILVEPNTTYGEQSATPLTFVLLLALSAPLALRRRHPVQVFLVILCAMVIYQALNYEGLNADFFGPIVALYSAIVYGPRRFARWAPVMLLAGVMATTPFSIPDNVTVGSFIAESVNAIVLVGLVWFVSDTVRQRRAQARELAAKNLELEHARDELARQAVADERVRIARELHDVVAHSMSVIAVQSGVGRMVIADQPEEAAKALASIEETSRSSLNEMRRILSVLRSGDQTEGSLEPAPTLLDLDHLLEQIRAAGVPVDLEVTGDRGTVPAGVDLSAYRIIQEALTNVIKHAGPARASVTVTYAPTVVTVEVADDGRGAAALVATANGARGGAGRHEADAGVLGGKGLVGMRERVAVYGGDVVAGPRAGGGFHVRARLPYDGSRG
jgi:signal transduction histidine kinase